jgi:hypothetical protein
LLMAVHCRPAASGASTASSLAGGGGGLSAHGITASAHPSPAHPAALRLYEQVAALPLTGNGLERAPAGFVSVTDVALGDGIACPLGPGREGPLCGHAQRHLDAAAIRVRGPLHLARKIQVIGLEAGLVDVGEVARWAEAVRVPSTVCGARIAAAASAVDTSEPIGAESRVGGRLRRRGVARLAEMAQATSTSEPLFHVSASPWVGSSTPSVPCGMPCGGWPPLANPVGPPPAAPQPEP